MLLLWIFQILFWIEHQINSRFAYVSCHLLRENWLKNILNFKLRPLKLTGNTKANRENQANSPSLSRLLQSTELKKQIISDFFFFCRHITFNYWGDCSLKTKEKNLKWTVAVHETVTFLKYIGRGFVSHSSLKCFIIIFLFKKVIYLTRS